MIYFAHVKWFVPFEELTEGRGWEFSLADSTIQIGLALVLIALVVAFLLERKLKSPVWLKSFVDKYGMWVLWASNFLIGFFLLMTAYQGVLFTPIFEVNGVMEKIASLFTVVAGVLLLTNFKVWFAGVLLAMAYVMAGFFYGFDEMIEHVHLLGIAVFVFLNDKPPFLNGLVEKWRPKSLQILRVLTGVALMILAWNEKLAHPVLAEEFLKTHPWNFMHDLMDLAYFSDRTFALAAGVSEFLFGLLFVLGWVTRINTLAMAVFFLTTAFILGPMEVLGHLPVFAIAVLFLVWGKAKSGFEMAQR